MSPENLLHLHHLIIEALVIADRDGLLDAGIALDSARLSVERRLKNVGLPIPSAEIETPEQGCDDGARR